MTVARKGKPSQPCVQSSGAKVFTVRDNRWTKYLWVSDKETRTGEKRWKSWEMVQRFQLSSTSCPKASQSPTGDPTFRHSTIYSPFHPGLICTANICLQRHRQTVNSFWLRNVLQTSVCVTRWRRRDARCRKSARQTVGQMLQGWGDRREPDSNLQQALIYSMTKN